MFRTCKFTGRIGHKFDPVTHQCPCGHWERGHKPKVEPVKPRGECQICARKLAMDVGGSLLHHGYQRPGFGFIVGDCYGVGHEPYPKTDALKIWLKAMKNMAADLKKSIASLPETQEITYSWTAGWTNASYSRVLKKGDERQLDAATSHYIPSFADEVKNKIAWSEARLKITEGEIRRIKERITAAKHA